MEGEVFRTLRGVRGGAAVIARQRERELPDDDHNVQTTSNWQPSAVVAVKGNRNISYQVNQRVVVEGSSELSTSCKHFS